MTQRNFFFLLQGPLFMYRYGYSFLLAVTGLMSSELAGTFAIFLCIHRYVLPPSPSATLAVVSKCKLTVNKESRVYVSSFGSRYRQELKKKGLDRKVDSFLQNNDAHVPHCRRHCSRFSYTGECGACRLFCNYFPAFGNYSRFGYVRSGAAVVDAARRVLPFFPKVNSAMRLPGSNSSHISSDICFLEGFAESFRAFLASSSAAAGAAAT